MRLLGADLEAWLVRNLGHRNKLGIFLPLIIVDTLDAQLRLGYKGQQMILWVWIELLIHSRRGTRIRYWLETCFLLRHTSHNKNKFNPLINSENFNFHKTYIRFRVRLLSCQSAHTLPYRSKVLILSRKILQAHCGKSYVISYHIDILSLLWIPTGNKNNFWVRNSLDLKIIAYLWCRDLLGAGTEDTERFQTSPHFIRLVLMRSYNDQLQIPFKHTQNKNICPSNT